MPAAAKIGYASAVREYVCGRPHDMSSLARCVILAMQSLRVTTGRRPRLDSQRRLHKVSACLVVGQVDRDEARPAAETGRGRTHGHSRADVETRRLHRTYDYMHPSHRPPTWTTSRPTINAQSLINHSFCPGGAKEWCRIYDR